MIVKSTELQQVCKDILAAVDSNEISTVTETLELEADNKVLYLSVTNREYYAKVRMNIESDEHFHATVNANLFLKLISKITTFQIGLAVEDRTLIITGNGTYRLPLIYDNDALLELPVIQINNPSVEFIIGSDLLMSILNFNTKQLSVGTISKPVQKLYYVDNEGALTFTSGACVNKFTLPQPVKMLLNQRLVKLFKLFRSKDVKFILGHEPISDEIIQTRVRFESDNVVITAILSCDDAMLNSVPVHAIRQRASSVYPYSVNLNKDALEDMIDRLLLFTTSNSKEVTAYSLFEFGTDSVVVYDEGRRNKEVIKYNNDTTNIEETYSATIDLYDLKAVIEALPEQYVNISFGDGQAFLVNRPNITNIIPEIHKV